MHKNFVLHTLPFMTTCRGYVNIVMRQQGSVAQLHSTMLKWLGDLRRARQEGDIGSRSRGGDGGNLFS